MPEPEVTIEALEADNDMLRELLKEALPYLRAYYTPEADKIADKIDNLLPPKGEG